MSKTKLLRTGAVTLSLALGCQGLLGIEEGTPLPAETCRLNSDCADGSQICVFEKCSPPCRADKDCGSGQRCLEGVDGAACVSATAASCAEATDCPEGTACVDAECRTACSKASDCRADQVCADSGACVGKGEVTPTPGAGGDGGSQGISGSGGKPPVGAVGGAGAGPDEPQGGQGGAPPIAVGGEGGEPVVVITPTPNTTITSTPPDPDNTTGPTFEFTSSIAGSTFQCKLDAGNFSACTSPRKMTIAGEGDHTFAVAATAGGKTDPTPASYSWKLDTTLPAVDIVTGPAAVTSSANANFTLSAEAGATLACKLDAGAFGACTSATTHALTGLATGSHTLTLRATDAANNQATDTHEWFIEPPCNPSEVEIESFTQPTGWNTSFGGVLHGGQARSASSINAPLTFAFEGKGLTLYFSKGPNFGTFTIAIDNSTPISISALDANGFSYQQPQVIVTGLANKTHTVEIICKTTQCVVDYYQVTCN